MYYLLWIYGKDDSGGHSLANYLEDIQQVNKK